ncbi:MAG: MATE family efflux transporter [Rhodobacteraceae bacterium]|nr:MATE family efflux transporter [Paracoccaceae bacterium]
MTRRVYVDHMAPSQMTFQNIQKLFVLGLPIVGSNLAMMLIGVTDIVMVGWHSVEELAALILATTLFFNIFILGSGVAFAVMPIVSSAAAVGDDTTVRRSTRMALWISMIYGIFALPIFYMSETILLGLGQQPELAQYAADYMWILAPAIISSLWANVMRSYLSAMEFTKIIMLITCGVAILNVGFNHVLIFGNYGFPELGIQGAAIASLLVNFLMAVITSIYAVYILPQHDLFARFYRPDWGALIKVFKLGAPIGLSILAETGLFSAASVMMGWIGVIALAAHGIALQLASLTFMAHLGLSHAVTIRMGNAAGRKDWSAMVQVTKAGAVISVCWSLLTIILFVGFGAQLISLFLDADEAAREAIIAYGVVLLWIAALFQLVDGGQVLAIGLLRGVQDTAIPMVITVIGYWGVGVPIAYFLGFYTPLAGSGIWLGLVAGLSFAAIGLSARFRRYLANYDAATA